MLIDAGDNSEGTAVQSYLDSQNVEKIDYAIGTHPDADHIGGLDVVVYKFHYTFEEAIKDWYRDNDNKYLR